MSYNLPNPSLVGILLAVSTHNGPQIIFSYPKDFKSSAHSSAQSDDDDFDDEDYEAAEFQATDMDATGLIDSWNVQHSDFYLGSKLDLLNFLDAKDMRMRQHEPALDVLPSNELLVQAYAQNPCVVGLELDQLSELLCPPRAMCNRRFDMMLENHVFLGFPVHVNRHGVWREKKPPESKKKSVLGLLNSNQREATPSQDGDVTEGSPQAQVATALSMFHLVFVMDPPNIERNYRVDEMFYNVVSKLSLILRYEQHKSNYVGSQVQQIFKLKELWQDGVGDLTAHLVQRSAICRMIADCFYSLRELKIASLNINGKLRSFQVPLKMEFLSLPDSTVPYIPGSYLSSTCCGASGKANLGETTRYNNSNKFLQLLLGSSPDRGDGDMDFAEEDDDSADHSNPDDVIYLALLLYDEPDQIIKDIKADPNTEIAKFIRLITPTELLLRILNVMQAQHSSQLDLGQIKSFALHLVYWRRARIIPPLSTRSIYIVSPMAPLTTNFIRDVPKFAQMFPTVPSLPSFLKLLSTRTKKPRQFASIIPSRDHKDMYLLALLWLVRYGYVTQLHTYIWLKVSKKVKMNVEEEIEEELSRHDNKSRKELSSDSKVDNSSKKPNPVDNSSKSAEPVDNSSKQKRMHTSTLEDEISRIQKKLEASNSLPDLVLESDGDTILVDPGRASALERRWLERIVNIECNLSLDLTTVFYRLLKYMNGKNSLEVLLLRENVSRSDLRRLLLAIEDHIISVRHW